jgi:hypothetical protein
MARFPGAFTRSGNLVVGPLALMGGATYTPPNVVRRHGGNKFPLLVKAGHAVTIRVASRSRAVATLGYGRLPEGEAHVGDGHREVRFVACRVDERSGSDADGRPVTFWSGFVMTRAPACVSLDVFVGGERAPRRAGIPLGRHCQRPPPLRTCASRAEGNGPPASASRPGDVVLGPVALAGLGRVAGRAGLEHYRSGRRYLIKAGAVVLAGARATLVVGRQARRWAALTYATRRLRSVGDGHAAVRFRACRHDEPAFSYTGPVGLATGFAGGFILSRAGCVPLEVRVAGRRAYRARVPFGTGRCR